MTKNQKFDVEKTIGVALHQSSYLFKTAMRSVFQEQGVDITPEELVTLGILPKGDIDQSELVIRLRKDKTNVTRLLSRMEGKGWIRRATHAQSGRQLTVSITPSGQDIAKQLFPHIQKMASGALQGIDDADIETTRRTLIKLANNLVD